MNFKVPGGVREPTGKVIVDMNFKVTDDFHRLVKSEAVARRMRMRDMMVAAFRHYFESFSV